MAHEILQQRKLTGGQVDQPIGVVAIDSLFSPVTRVRYAVESARVGQRTDYDRLIVEIWTDGRALPSGENLENLGPAWYGHSVGKWEGNKLIVNTVGLEERAWLDNAGHPKSFHARIEETWERVDSNTLENQLTLYDPEYYTAPWVGSKKIYKRMPPDAITYFGWNGLFAGISEGICAPMNEVEGYNKGFRDIGTKPR